jgi:hypothetical protein
LMKLKAEVSFEKYNSFTFAPVIKQLATGIHQSSSIMYPVKGSAVLQENKRNLVSPRRTKVRQNMAKVKNDESKET